MSFWIERDTPMTKKKVDELDARPSKRIYKSIIPDYHFELGLCELIDNALDNWIYEGKRNALKINLDLDYDQGVIYVKDNSGGIAEKDMQLIVSPGLSRDSNHDEIIGIFGVGSKRAAVALAEEIKVTSRYGEASTFQIEYGEEWIKDTGNWSLDLYQVEDLEPNTTVVELSRLREKLNKEDEDVICRHLSYTYALFLIDDEVEILLDGSPIEPITFDKWSYPPGFEPMLIKGNIRYKSGEEVKFEVVGGLTKSKEPSGGEFGAYFYCNNRLISRAYKGEEVGYKIARIGKPHPGASLARAIVKLYGSPDLMPWNSSKSEIDTKHYTYKEIVPHLEKILFTYSTMSKRWSTGGGWEENVFKYSTGVIREATIENLTSQTRIHTPAIPRKRYRKYSDQIRINNRQLGKDKPWTKGAYEGIIAVEELPKLKLDQNNRLSLLILDSTLEIAFKDFLIHEKKIQMSDMDLTKLMRNRSGVHNRVMKETNFEEGTWDRVEYFYQLRSDLIHKRSSGDIRDDELETFKETVQYILSELMNINFDRAV